MKGEYEMNGEQFWPKSHYELNYLVNEECALRIREYVRSYLDMDLQSVGRPDYSSAVHTLYLDSDDLKLYWRAINDCEHRCELRVRKFSLAPNAPVYLEIKTRQSDLVLRDRCFLSCETVQEILEGQWPGDGESRTTNLSIDVVVQKFLRLMQSMDAKPKLHVFYHREAYVTDEDTVKVSLDRHISCEADPDGFWTGQARRAIPLFGNDVLLELNFEGRFPQWLKELVETFNLIGCEADKFVQGISACGSTLHAPLLSQPFRELPYEQ